MPRFAGPPTFARLPRIDQVAPESLDGGVAILGAPFDAGTSYRPGARFGPGHIRASSRLLRPFHPGLGVSPFAARQVVDAGDLALNPFDIPAALGDVEAGVGSLRASGMRVVTLGGDHTLALPILRAVARGAGPVAVVHFDAHLDTWDTYFGAPYTHGTPFRRASEEGLIDLYRSVHVGTRGPLYSDYDLRDDAVLGFQVIPADAYEADGVAGVAGAMLRRLGDGPVYVSVDVDVLDPAHAPGTGTPEAGGLTSRELLLTLRALAGRELLGADVVEVAPAYDHAEITGVAAAHITYELLALMATG
ncbi:agmatinase [Tomitella gaofuii]|uniref:agmatinase n=1 Tax=Tomitella gaofuii TaxID=2760083 RepID=UPI001F39195D|nr:agmatinase [Tomitella gaofuii]